MIIVKDSQSLFAQLRNLAIGQVLRVTFKGEAQDRSGFRQSHFSQLMLVLQFDFRWLVRATNAIYFSGRWSDRQGEIPRTQDFTVMYPSDYSLMLMARILSETAETIELK